MPNQTKICTFVWSIIIGSSLVINSCSSEKPDSSIFIGAQDSINQPIDNDFSSIPFDENLIFVLDETNMIHINEYWTHRRTGLDDDNMPPITTSASYLYDNKLRVDGMVDFYGRKRIPILNSQVLIVKITMRQMTGGEIDPVRHIIGAFSLDIDGNSVVREFKDVKGSRNVFLPITKYTNTYVSKFEILSPEAAWVRPHIRFNFSQKPGVIVEVDKISVSVE